MAKMSVVTLGFLLTLVVYLFFGNYEFFGLMIVGFIVGYIAKDGILGGLWNAALAGSLGTILIPIISRLGYSFEYSRSNSFAFGPLATQRTST